MNHKKVAVFYSGSEYWGGIDTYLLNLFKYYDRSKVDLTLLSLGSWAVVREAEKQGGKVKVFSKRRLNPYAVFKIAKYLKIEKFDLIVSGGLVADSYSRAASLFSGVPHLSVVHSEFKYDYPNIFVRGLYATLLVLSRWKTKRYIAVSEYLKRLMVQSGVSGKKIDVIYNGVDQPAYESKDNDKAINGITIGSIGRLHMVKNYGALIEAISMLKSRDISLMIVGEGKERGKLENLIKKLEIEDGVKLFGHQSNLASFFSTVDIYVQPSLSEGFGLTVVEALMAELPVVVTPAGSLPEIVKNGETGIVANGFNASDIADAIEKLLDDPKYRERISQNGQKYALEKFNVKNWANKTVETFLETAK